MSEAEVIPPPYSAEEAWICDHFPDQVRIEHRQTGCDTADTYVHLRAGRGKEVCWKDWTFNRVAVLKVGICTVAEPKPGIREKVQERRKWERKNARELAEYKRLHARFKGAL